MRGLREGEGREGEGWRVSEGKKEGKRGGQKRRDEGEGSQRIRVLWFEKTFVQSPPLQHTYIRTYVHLTTVTDHHDM